MEAGWYRITGEMTELDGRLASPCLYPDYGEGVSEGARIDFSPPLASGQLDLIVYFSLPLVSLRLDPTISPARFTLANLQVLALSQREAYWLLLRRNLSIELERDPPAAKALADESAEALRIAGIDAGIAKLPAPPGLGALGGQDAYVGWCTRADRWLNQLTVPRLDAGSSPVLSLVVNAPPGEDLEACLQSIASLHGSGVEVILDEAEAVFWPPGRSDSALLIVVPAGASLAARLRAAGGCYVMCIAATDRVHSRLSVVVASAAVECPEAPIFYCDEDRIDSSGVRTTPWFKPAWDPLMWYEQDYLGRSAIVSRKAAWKALDDVVEPATSWFSLLLHVVHEHSAVPVHLPHVLRHVTAVSLATISAPMESVGERTTARVDIWNRHFARLRKTDRIADLGDGRQHYLADVEAWPAVDIVVPTRDRVELLRMCIEGLIKKTSYPNYRITIVDNGSIDPASHVYFRQIAEDPRVRVLPYAHPFNYSAINNYAVAQCSGDIVVLLNNDIEIVDGQWLETMVRIAVQPGVGAVGAKLHYPDGRVQHAGVVLGVGGVAAHAFAGRGREDADDYGRTLVTQRYSAVTAACLAVRRAVYLSVGGLDETLAVAFNDVDFCLRLRARGLFNAWTPHAQAYHHESASRGIEDDPVKQSRFASEVAIMQARWRTVLAHDAAYSPNLSLSGPAFAIDPDRHAEAVIRRVAPTQPEEDAPPEKSSLFD